MRKSIFIAVSTGLFFISLFSSAQLCYGIFSKFENITPITANKHKFDVSFSSDGKNSINVSFPWESTSKHCWLIVFNKDNAPKTQRNFRNYIWTRERENMDVEKIRKLEVNADGHIEIKLPEKLIQRSFIIIDFPSRVFDGGFYYTIDLPEYQKQLKQTNLQQTR